MITGILFAEILQLNCGIVISFCLRVVVLSYNNFKLVKSLVFVTNSNRSRWGLRKRNGPIIVSCRSRRLSLCYCAHSESVT